MDDILRTNSDHEDVTVTVIIPYAEKYTPEDLLERAIESAKSQVGVDTEIMVIEDENERGPAWARNVGLDRAETRYVAFLDGDDVWVETKLVDQIEKMEETGAGMCVDGNQEYEPLEFIGALLTDKTFALTSSILLDTEAIDLRFDESLDRREDHLFMIEAAARVGVCFLPETFEVGKYEQGFSKYVEVSERQIHGFFEDVVERVPQAEQFEDEYYQTSYVYLGRREHFEENYLTALEYYMTSLRYGPNVKAVGAIGLTLLAMVYGYSIRPIQKFVAGSSQE